MTRINRPDTLLTELREIKRRLSLLEAVRMRPGTATAAGPSLSSLSTGSTGAAVIPPVSVPLMPARSIDWPWTSSPEWERLLVTWAALGEHDAQITVLVVADPGSEDEQRPLGTARITVDGAQVGDVLPVTEAAGRYAIAVPADNGSSLSEVAVEARLTHGVGAVRVAAVLRCDGQARVGRGGDDR